MPASPITPLRAGSLAAVAAVALLASAVPAGGTTATPTRAQMVGQRLMVSFSGTTASTSLLTRIRTGQIGGVILFSGNITSAAQLTRLTSRLQAAARAGGRPKLLIATDQEGGLVKRLPWAPPRLSAQELGTASPSHIALVGRNTGAALRACGVNLDLAPVADVPRSSSNFIYLQHRAFGTSRYVVSAGATAFAKGLEQGGALPALKHFPGLGRAGSTSTDNGVVHITATRTQISYDLLPYRTALAHALRPVIMLSTAVYPAYSPRPAAWSKAIAVVLLRSSLGFHGVTITDSLTSAAAVRGTTPSVLAVKSAKVGVDLLLVTGADATSEAAYTALLRAAQAGTIPLANLQASYARILALKARA